MNTLKRLIRPVVRIARSLLRPFFPQKLVNYAYHLPSAYLASKAFGNPMQDLEIIGVTGTDGKTTTSSLIYHILKTARKKVAVINTVEAKIGRKSIKTGFHVTSPDPWSLQRLLRQIRSKKLRYVVLEVTSHGIDQFRFYPLRPTIAVLTNITHEHLDYHQTFENYRDTKLKLLKNAKHAVVNKDLPIFTEINSRLSGTLFSTYSLRNSSQLKPSHVRYNKNTTTFTLGSITYTVPLTGKYNLYNCLAAISAALILNIAPSDIKRALLSFPPIKGRLEEIKNSRRLKAYVDFAHTPNALQNVLANLSAHKGKGKLIAIFGSAGLRDHTKRPLMGQAASRYADQIILTSEDPRTEDPSKIAQDIMSGIDQDKHKNVIIELNREKAIIKGVSLAQPGDTLVVCGKGHEETMCFGETEYPWSDQKALIAALKGKK